MIAIDTNVLLRYLLQDEKAQSAKVNKLFSLETEILITDVVLVETIWTLKGKRYKASKENLLQVIDQLFKEPNIIFEDGQTIWRAYNAFRNAEIITKNHKKQAVDFPNLLILEKVKQVASKKDIEFDGLFSFDSALQAFTDVFKP